MGRIFRTVVRDFLGLARVCGLGVALRWLMQIALHARTCIRTRTLQSADRGMGSGPFYPKLRGARAKIEDPYAISSIREVWVRDVYTNGGYIEIAPGGVVPDLGANRGFFTALALGTHPDTRCVCVEPRVSDCERIRHLLEINDGWENRCDICSAFIGGETQFQRDMVATESGIQNEYLSEDEFIRRFNLSKINLIKCDIEGSEFELFRPGSKLLAMAQQVAMEVHAPAGRQRDDFINLVRNEGFDVVTKKDDAQGCIINGRRKR